MSAIMAEPIVGYRFTVTCPNCGGPVGEINRVRQGPHSQITVVACAGRCRRHYDLTVRLTSIPKDGRR